MRKIVLFLFLFFLISTKFVHAYNCCTDNANSCNPPDGYGWSCNNCGNMSCYCDSGTICVPDQPAAQPTNVCARYGQQCSSNLRCCSGSCYANTCVNVYIPPPTVGAGTPVPTNPPAYCAWYTNPDYCSSSGCTVDYGNSNGTGDYCCNCPSGPPVDAACDWPPVPQYMSIGCDRGLSKMMMGWDPNVDIECSVGVSFKKNGYPYNSGSSFFSQNFWAIYTSAVTDISINDYYNDYTVTGIDAYDGSKNSWVNNYNPITNFNGDNDDRTFSCNDTFGRVTDINGTPIEGAKVILMKCIYSDGGSNDVANCRYGLDPVWIPNASGNPRISGQLVLTTDSSGYYYTPYELFELPSNGKNTVPDSSKDPPRREDSFDRDFVTGYAVSAFDRSGKYLTTSGGVEYTGQKTGGLTTNRSINCAFPVGGLRTSVHLPYRGQCDFIFQNKAPDLRYLNTRDLDDAIAAGANRIPASGNFVNGNFIDPENMSAFGIGASVNQVCDTRFNDDLASKYFRNVSFRLRIGDSDSYSDIAKIKLKFENAANSADSVVVGANIDAVSAVNTITIVDNPSGGISYALTPTSESFSIGDTGTDYQTAIIQLKFDTTQNKTYKLKAYAEDKYGMKLAGSPADGWVDTGRKFKVWDCNVPVMGTVYDASACGASCSGDDFYTTKYSGSLFTSLLFDHIDPGKDLPALVGSPDYSRNGRFLIWGNNYSTVFNSDIDIPNLSNPGLVVSRITDMGRSVKKYDGGSVVSLINAVLNPYFDNPTVVVDFTGVKNQLPWYQVGGGGMQAGSGGLVNALPITCREPGCTSGYSINSQVGASDSGLVSGNTISNSSGCAIGDCPYGPAGRAWYKTGANLVSTVNYENLYNEIFVKKGIGTKIMADNSTFTWQTVFDSISAAADPIVFLDLTNKTGSTLLVYKDYPLLAGEYLIMIVKGNVEIDPGVNIVGGSWIVDGDFIIDGVSGSNQQLVFEGSVYANSVRVTRKYFDESLNNTSPAVKINYRPDFLFNMPASILEGLGSWSVGGR